MVHLEQSLHADDQWCVPACLQFCVSYEKGISSFTSSNTLKSKILCYLHPTHSCTWRYQNHTILCLKVCTIYWVELCIHSPMPNAHFDDGQQHKYEGNDPANHPYDDDQQFWSLILKWKLTKIWWTTNITHISRNFILNRLLYCWCI